MLNTLLIGHLFRVLYL